MPTITAVASYGLNPLLRALAKGAGATGRSVRMLMLSLRNRREAGRLAGLDDRMLADIGLTRSDLRDAYAEPLWHDPTDVLARRAAERRFVRPSKDRPNAGAGHRRLADGDTAPLCYPPIDRPARYLM